MRSFSPHHKRTAFTLVELMVSTAIIALIMVILVGMTNQMSKTWRDTTEKVEKFQEARDGFEAMTRRLADATLNTNWDYLGVDSVNTDPTHPKPRVKTVAPFPSQFASFVPLAYGRTTDLRFISGPMTSTKTDASGNSLGLGTNPQGTSRLRPTHGIFFQAPFGVADLSTQRTWNGSGGLPENHSWMGSLNTWGYYVEADIDRTVPSFLSTVKGTSGVAFVKPRFRARLMEFRQPTEMMSVYDPNNANPTRNWYALDLANASDTSKVDYKTDATVRSLAENIVALILVPKLSKSDEDNIKASTVAPPSAWQLCPWYFYDTTLTGNPGMTALAPGVNTATVNPKNQLPPVVQVTMVAIDERSAKALNEKYGPGENSLGANNPMAYMGLDIAGNRCNPVVNFTGLFTNQAADVNGSTPNGTPLEGPLGNPNDPNIPKSDLNALQQIFIHEKVSYRIFTSDITIRGAKWSRVQTQ